METTARRSVRLIAACALAIGLSGFAPAGPLAPPAAAAAPAGRPTRIISLVPAVTEMLFAIGAGPRVVAVSSYDHEPPQVNRLPRVGALLDPDLERILTLRPDLVIVDPSQRGLMQQLARAGIASFPVGTAGLQAIMTTIRRLGARVGSAPDADALADRLTRQLDAVRAAVAGRPRPRTLLVFERTPFALSGIYASGGVGFLSDMLQIAGGDNVFAGVKRQSVQISTETVLELAPQVILELHERPMSPVDLARDRDSWQVLGSVPAVRHHRVELLVGNDLMVPGPRIAEATEQLARALHPDVDWKAVRGEMKDKE
ncbi:MAG TPA: helical backbone metal receptor [Vicinamibacterales bacterium]|nr:helical backbone metal receptor [Vicinamibacterales bacterium]